MTRIPQPPFDRRTTPRHLPGPLVACRLLAPGRSAVVRLLNICQIGAFVESPWSFEPGTRLDLVLSNTHLGTSCDVRVRILRCETAGGAHHLGCQFLRPLFLPDLLRLLERPRLPG